MLSDVRTVFKSHKQQNTLNLDRQLTSKALTSLFDAKSNNHEKRPGLGVQSNIISQSNNDIAHAPMAPPPEVYFPSLDSCLSTDTQLISWRSAYLRLTSSDAELQECDSLFCFLSCPESVRILSAPFDPFLRPSEQTKSAFESKTAAINAVSGSQSPYNFDEIKKDALWLSKTATIDEVSALRIAVLNWQGRAENDLLNQFSNEEIASLRDAIGNKQLSQPTSGIEAVELLKGTARDASSSSPLSQDERQLELFQLYLSEKQWIIKLALYLLCVSLREDLPSSYTGSWLGPTESQTRKHSKRDQLATLAFPKQREDDSDTHGTSIRACIDAIQLRLSNIDAGTDWLSQEAEYTRQLSITEEVVHIMQILFLRIQTSNKIPTSELLLLWLRVTVKYDFFNQHRPSTEQELVLFNSLQALTSIITLSFLKLRTATALFETASKQPSNVSDVWGNIPPSFLSRQDIGELNEIFLKAADSEKLNASPAMFAWGIIMFSVREIALATREDRELRQAQNAVDAYNGSTSSAFGSGNADPSIYEDAYEKARNPAFDDDFVKFIISIAVDRCRVFDVMSSIMQHLDCISGLGHGNLVAQWARIEILDLVRASLEFLDYIPELLSTLLQILAVPNEEWNRGVIFPITNCNKVKDVFLRDETLMSKIFKIAKSRFPYEAINFLKLCRSLLDCDLSTDDGYPIVFPELETMETYTQMISSGFQGYQSTREDENANFVSLIQPLEMREVSSRKTAIHQPGTELIVIKESSMLPASTLGQVVNETKPAIIMWHHQYNCLAFLGMWLEQAAYNREAGFELDDGTVAEIISLLGDLVTSAQTLAKSKGIESCAKKILEMASDGLSVQGDIISVIFDIFERHLQNATNKTTNHGLQTSMSCLSFLNALVPVIPGRVWPFLTRSSFIAGGSNEGALPAIISAFEVNSGNFSFLLEAIQTFKLVVDDALKHVAVRKTAGNVTSKASHVAEYTAGAPSYVMSGLLQSFVRIMIDVYNSNASWRYNDIRQSLQLNILLTDTFQDILYYTYGVDDAENLDTKLTSVFAPAAKYLLSMLRPSSTEGIFFNPVLRLILSGYQTAPSENVYLRWLQPRLVTSVLRLSMTIIQAGWVPNSQMTVLETQLFNASPVLIRLYVLHPTYQLPVANLLELLVAHASTDSEHEPPSLLGHLGAQSSCRFLDILSKFDRPFDNITLTTSIWRFLTTIISKRQQWLAVFLLTGSSPRDALKKEKSSMKSKAFLQVALDLVSSIGEIPSHLAASILDFISKAQENWPWTTPQLRAHPDLFPKLVNFVAGMTMKRLAPYEQCLNTKIASLVADISAIYLHGAKELRDRTFFKTLIPLISWYSDNAVEVDGYNASLHANLKRNFEMKYPGCSLFAIKKTSLDRPSFGADFFYDIVLGTKIFGYEFAWVGSRNQGFVDEVKRANENLSLVQAQMDLLRSFKFLAIEHCGDFMPDRGVQMSMVSVVRHCLTANSRSVPNENLFCKLHQIRAEFALALLQRLVQIQSKGNETFSLLQVVWDTIQFRHSTYETALANDDSEYYGMLLNILFLTLQFHVVGRTPPIPDTVTGKPEVSGHLAIVLDIVKVIIAGGFRSLTTYLHDEPQKVLPKDFALLTAILQTTLKVKNVDRIYEQIAFHLANCDTIRYACTLFSWSYKLTVDGDPLYGELSILYLLELSCIPMMAEQMAVEGILVKLSTYRLTDVLRQPQGCDPFDQTPRLFTIWQAGILPLCLNLLYHVGRAAAEVSAFLNQFEGQLRRASDAFAIGHPTAVGNTFVPSSPHRGIPSAQSVKHLSLGIATEACSLGLISMIIRKFRKAGPSAGVDAERIQEIQWDHAQVKEDIEILLEKKSILRSRIGPTNEKEMTWSQTKPSTPTGGAGSLLEEKIVHELQTALSCIAGGEDD
ncbi:hypothetical protein LOZ66_000061 [Ophidiomyces ophidiicola]|nr:hypothetical protein LOZ66_000061 [Ophidiomyces ophidiicola]